MDTGHIEAVIIAPFEAMWTNVIYDTNIIGNPSMNRLLALHLF